MPKIEDYADVPVFVGGVFRTYSDIGRAVSFALSRSDHVDIAPAGPQRGTRKLGLEGPRLALPHPSQFKNGNGVGTGNGKGHPLEDILIEALAAGPITRADLEAKLSGKLTHGQIAGALSRLCWKKKTIRLIHGKTREQNRYQLSRK